MSRRPLGLATALVAALLALAACGGGSSKSAASSDSTSSSRKSTSSSSSSDTGGGSAAGVSDKGSFCTAAKDIADANVEVTGAVVTILSSSQSGGGGSFPSDAEKSVQALGPRLSKDYDAMVNATSGSLKDSIVTLRDFSAKVFQPIVDASSRDEFTSAINGLIASGNSADAKAAAKATTDVDGATSSACNVHIAANQ